MAPLRSLPLARDTDAAVDENGVSYDLRPVSHGGKMVTQIKIYVGGLSFVGWGDDSTPPAAATTNTVYQESGETETYPVGNSRGEDRPDYFYVYAESTSVTHAVRVSFFY